MEKKEENVHTKIIKLESESRSSETEVFWIFDDIQKMRNKRQLSIPFIKKDLLPFFKENFKENEILNQHLLPRFEKIQTSQPIITLFGPPGTGKSRFINQLLNNIGQEILFPKFDRPMPSKKGALVVTVAPTFISFQQTTFSVTYNYPFGNEYFQIKTKNEKDAFNEIYKVLTSHKSQKKIEKIFITGPFSALKNFPGLIVDTSGNSVENTKNDTFKTLFKISDISIFCFPRLFNEKNYLTQWIASLFECSEHREYLTNRKFPIIGFNCGDSDDFIELKSEDFQRQLYEHFNQVLITLMNSNSFPPYRARQFWKSVENSFLILNKEKQSLDNIWNEIQIPFFEEDFIYFNRALSSLIFRLSGYKFDSISSELKELLKKEAKSPKWTDHIPKGDLDQISTNVNTKLLWDNWMWEMEEAYNICLNFWCEAIAKQIGLKSEETVNCFIFESGFYQGKENQRKVWEEYRNKIEEKEVDNLFWMFKQVAKKQQEENQTVIDKLFKFLDEFKNNDLNQTLSDNQKRMIEQIKTIQNSSPLFKKPPFYSKNDYNRSISYPFRSFEDQKKKISPYLFKQIEKDLSKIQMVEEYSDNYSTMNNDNIFISSNLYNRLVKFSNQLQKLKSGFLDDNLFFPILTEIQESELVLTLEKEIPLWQSTLEIANNNQNGNSIFLFLCCFNLKKETVEKSLLVLNSFHCDWIVLINFSDCSLLKVQQKFVQFFDFEFFWRIEKRSLKNCQYLNLSTITPGPCTLLHVLQKVQNWIKDFKKETFSKIQNSFKDTENEKIITRSLKITNLDEYYDIYYEIKNNINTFSFIELFNSLCKWKYELEIKYISTQSTENALKRNLELLNECCTHFVQFSSFFLTKRGYLLSAHNLHFPKLEAEISQYQKSFGNICLNFTLSQINYDFNNSSSNLNDNIFSTIIKSSLENGQTSLQTFCYCG